MLFVFSTMKQTLYDRRVFILFELIVAQLVVNQKTNYLVFANTT